ncbi:glycosyl hydrolases family 11 domain-containing protein [Sarocladium implicatum]|nr:glycosyl hydrolases family 11 domain-containing protein [Sarocladium implicatum]
MILSAILLTAFAAAAGVASVSTGEIQDLEARQNRFTTQYWANDFASLNWTSGAAGQFNLTWNNGFGGNFVVGKGYRPSVDMLFNYSGTFDLDRNAWAYLTLYGWTRNPLVEWYVIEAMGAHNPSDNRSATLYGHVESDGATYEVWQKKRTNAPSIDGDNTDFEQYWSVRTSMHVGGTINTGNHWRAWKEMGLELGTHQYMALAVEGQRGSGKADLTAGVFPTTSFFGFDDFELFVGETEQQHQQQQFDHEEDE